MYNVTHSTQRKFTGKSVKLKQQPWVYSWQAFDSQMLIYMPLTITTNIQSLYYCRHLYIILRICVHRRNKKLTFTNIRRHKTSLDSVTVWIMYTPAVRRNPNDKFLVIKKKWCMFCVLKITQKCFTFLMWCHTVSETLRMYFLLLSLKRKYTNVNLILWYSMLYS